MVLPRAVRPFVLLCGLGACAASASPPANESTRVVSIRVAGFVEAAGITWMAWPNKVKEALDGLHGVHEVRVDLKDDRFDVTHDPEVVAVETMLETVRKRGYTPEVVAAKDGGDAPAIAAVDVSRLPEELRALLQRAGQAEKLVLLRFTGPGWVPCERMDTVTYPHPVVKRELDQHWLDARLDVISAKDVATLFGVSAIPTAIAVTEDGIVRGRVQGFAEPEAFRQQLEQLRAKR